MLDQRKVSFVWVFLHHLAQTCWGCWEWCGDYELILIIRYICISIQIMNLLNLLYPGQSYSVLLARTRFMFWDVYSKSFNTIFMKLCESYEQDLGIYPCWTVCESCNFNWPFIGRKPFVFGSAVITIFLHMFTKLHGLGQQAMKMWTFHWICLFWQETSMFWTCCDHIQLCIHGLGIRKALLKSCQVSHNFCSLFESKKNL